MEGFVMRKTLCVFLIFLMLLLCGCSDEQKPLGNEQSTLAATNEDVQKQSVIFPSINIFNSNWDSIFQDALKKSNTSFVIMDKIGKQYWGIKSKYNAERQEIDDKELLVEVDSNKDTSLTYPKNFPYWQVGSGSYVILKDRYLYEWRSYTSQFEEEDGHDMKLTRIDCNTGKVEIVDEFKLNSPLIYLCKIDEEHFLSYYVVKAPSEKIEYATLTVATIYNLDGTKKEIVREEYENDVDWTDSEGTLIERFAVKDGEIYGFGRRRISGAYKFFFYHYDKNGKLLETEAVPGFENIIGEEQPLEFWLVGDYIVFRTYESLTAYICKRTEDGIELIMKGADGNVSYAISTADSESQNSTYIFFIESNVNDDDTLKEKECPLYAIEVDSGKIKAANFPIPLENPYFVGLQALSNGDLLATYCESKYDVLKQKQFLLPKEKLHQLFNQIS